MIKPYEYQSRDIKEAWFLLESHRKILFQAQTSYGKTVVFSLMTKQFRDKNPDKKVVILCHREELVHQACETLMQMGLMYEKVLPSTKRYHHRADVYVCMIETVYNRLNENPHFLKNVGLVFADECHFRVFEKSYKFFNNAKIIGVTATPVALDKVNFSKCNYCETEYELSGICCGSETIEWTKPYSFSMEYENIVVGESVEKLIEFGSIVPEINYKRSVEGLDNLKTDSTGDFSKSSQDGVFGNEESVFNVLKNYEELALGKRTIIFNSSSKTNKAVYDQFKEAGYNVQMFDSVNDNELGRKSVVDWFKNNDDAILCNVGVFTAGFSVKEVQCIILNRATNSLSLYLQMVGRGARTSTKIFKQNFIVIDGGGNIDRFGRWSDSTRDWREIFFKGIGKPKAKKEMPDAISVCEKCSCMYDRFEPRCPSCGFEKVIEQKREPTVSDDVASPIQEIPPPNGVMIHNFTVSKNENIHFAFKILTDYIAEMFRMYRVSQFSYESAKDSGELDRKIDKFIRDCYFYLIKQDRYKNDTNRKLDYVIKKAKEKLEKHYAKK